MKRTKIFCCFLILLQFGGCATMGPSIDKADGPYDDKNPGGWAVYKVREDSLNVGNIDLDEINRDHFYDKSTEILVKTRYMALMHSDSVIMAIEAKADSLRRKKDNPLAEAFGGFALGTIIGGAIGGLIGSSGDENDSYVGDLGAVLGYFIGGMTGGLAMSSWFVYRSRMPNPSNKDKKELCTLLNKYNETYQEHLNSLQYSFIQAPRGQRLRKTDFYSKLKEIQDKSRRYLPEADSFRLQIGQQISELRDQDSLFYSKASPKNWENEDLQADRVKNVNGLIMQYNEAVKKPTDKPIRNQ